MQKRTAAALRKSRRCERESVESGESPSQTMRSGSRPLLRSEQAWVTPGVSTTLCPTPSSTSFVKARDLASRMTIRTRSNGLTRLSPGKLNLAVYPCQLDTSHCLIQSKRDEISSRFRRQFQ